MPILNRIKISPLFIIFLIISALFWYLNKISGQYVSSVYIPVTIEGTIDSSYTTDKNSYLIKCNVRGNGYQIISYTFLKNKETNKINTSQLSFSETPDKNIYKVDLRSLERALSSVVDNLELIDIIDKDINLHTFRYAEKKVAVIAPLKLNFKGKYMQVGKTFLEPCSVMVYGNSNIIDTLQNIFTKPKIISSKSNDLIGYLPLQESNNYKTANKDIYYKIEIEEYTEVLFSAAVDIWNGGQIVSASGYTSVPSKINVRCNVAHSYYKDFNPENILLYVDVSETNPKGKSSYAGDNRYRVNFYNSMIGVNIIDIEPAYLTILKNRTK